MPLLTWESSYSVGVTEIDKQHQKLFSLINDLFDAMKSGNGKGVIGSIIKNLNDYTVYHFGYEESYFEKFNYCDTVEHKKEHKKFVNTINKFQNDFADEKALLSIDVLNFLQSWLKEHINGTDKKYTTFFHEHGMN